ncbi:alpha/beta fold hydrolase [Allonocardiopsis opalescens]|uniref:TAP-like protein n=1 Tax=Allonocardiopsis opalescens TaxID=1144618 RepID=A0A2T0Q2I2_9ACTN|nr:alpha/beta fold hydrolase [Allonocardiopsis opalescens]PRX97995.1 TAP-like protein [Allonocardiopsis opalescens]
MVPFGGRRGGRVLAAGAAVLVAAGALSGGTASAASAAGGLADFYRQPVEWSACTEEALAGLECATVVVPMDYAEPGGERIEVALSRAPAADPGRRRGVLLLNPGGPGAEGRSLPALYQGQPITEVYDLIGFDPRGIGASTPLNCDAPEPGPNDVSSRPTDAQLPEFARLARAYEASCERAGGEFRRHVSTANTARDMDVVRAALGEERINYLGYSYGTYLGAVYGSLFPERLDRSVLDSSIHPDRIWRDTWRATAPAVTRNVDRFARWAAERDGTYGLGGSPDAVRATIEEIAAAAHQEPVDGMDRTAFDGFVGRQARWQAEWDLFAETLAGLRSPSARDAADAAEAVLLAEAAEPQPWSRATFTAVMCEADWPAGLGGYYREMREYRTEHPYGMGVMAVAPDPCTFRSFTPPEPPVELRRDGHPRGLVIQAEYDSQTVYAGGPAMARELGAGLVTIADDGGHAFYAVRGEGYGCVDAHVNRYLVDGVLPRGGAVCPGLPAPDVPSDDEPGSAPTAAQGDLAERMARAVETRGGLPTG